MQAEGHDRENLTLPGTQAALVSSAVAAANGKPVVVFALSGSALDLAAIQANPGVGAIAWVGYPGQGGGGAIANATFGVTNKWGKLPMTWYDSTFVKQVNMSDYRMRPDPKTGYPGRTHRFYTGRPAYPFGYGLSYTTFDRSMAVVGPAGGGANAVGAAAVDLIAVQRADGPWENNDNVVAVIAASSTNTGTVAGDDVVMLYVEPPAGAVAHGAAKEQLVAFKRVSMAPREASTFQFELQRRHLRVPPEAVDAANAAPWHLRLNDGRSSRVEIRVQIV